MSPCKSSPTDPVEGYIDRVLLFEGGFVDHPADRGGPTNYGISLGFARYCCLDLDDIRNLTAAQARSLYREHFYEDPNIGALPAPLQEPVFDWAVHSGEHRAIAGLQKVLNALRANLPVPGWNELTVDRRIGPRTATAADIALAERGQEGVIDPYVMARCEHYAAIVRRNQSQAVFIKGWLKRAERFFIHPRHPVWHQENLEYRI